MREKDHMVRKPGVQNSVCISHMGDVGCLPLPSQVHSWEANLKQSNQDVNQHFDMDCLHSKWELNPLHYNIDP